MEPEIKKIKNPFKLLAEIDAFLCFAIIGNNGVSRENAKSMRQSIRWCLENNGVDPDTGE